MLIDHARTRASLAAAAEQAAALLRRTANPGARMPNSEWTIAEAAAHVIASLRTYGGWAVGRGTAEHLDLERETLSAAIAKINDARIATITDRDPKSLADIIFEATRTFLDETEGLPAETPFRWYENVTIELASISCIMLAEILVHGYDMAATTGEPWPISAGDAEQMMLGAISLLPWYVNKATTRGVKASFEVRMRGGARVGIRLDDGAASVQLPASGRYDCVVSADPVSLLLVSYGRIGLWGPILRGKMIALGRKPWLGFKFTSYFLQP